MSQFERKVSTIVFVLLWIMLGKVATAETLSEPAQNHAGFTTDVTHLDFVDPSRKRPIKLTIWYPSGQDCGEAKICLSQEVNKSKTAVFSHGAMGAARGYNWIGHALASQGIVTVGINHYGESWVYGPEHIDPAAALAFWNRPQDVSFALDLMQANRFDNGEPLPLFSKKLGWNDVIAIGHSSGGATAIALAGGTFDYIKASAYCAAQPNDRSCGYMASLANLKETPPSSESYFDDRIKRVIALDPALGHLSEVDSLGQIRIPTLVIGSKQNDFLDYAQHAKFYASQIPTTEHLVLDSGEGHFVYLDECNLPHKAMGVSICVDKEQVNRGQAHQKMYAAIFPFIYR